MGCDAVEMTYDARDAVGTGSPAGWRATTRGPLGALEPTEAHAAATSVAAASATRAARARDRIDSVERIGDLRRRWSAGGRRALPARFHRTHSSRRARQRCDETSLPSDETAAWLRDRVRRSRSHADARRVSGVPIQAP